jgi:hypothetical protein
MSERIIARAFDTLASQPRAGGEWIDRIRINMVREVSRGERRFMMKTRRRGSRIVVRLANLFFRLAENPARVIVHSADWQRWEANSFSLLNGPDFFASPQGQRSVLFDALPGRSIASHLEDGTFRMEMVEAAGRELRRAHRLHSRDFSGAWSHGDSNLANLIYDPEEARVRLVDFELRHPAALPAVERHTADVLVLLQDLSGCVDSGEWVPAALRFLRAYDTPEIESLLIAKLAVPGGFAGLWWRIRCNFLERREIAERMEGLRAAFERSLSR